ncbi:conserved membrane hypothetical protein [Paraburkholderia piptadeniae]|uniref:Glycosyltransferase RgtA/B/C/D-like domain-containing protein n=2 Tax=Paraburkholderia piptadeniae TaxID=1701573 RepID=A0A1N7SS11_9BURK|nr:conserved membrane hypothetical protein [Paraburkholderia piptadeniae]
MLVALIGYGIVLFARQVLNDGDTYWHIAAGDWILRNGFVPHADPFSFSAAGAPWVAQEWLSEVTMALAYKAGAWDAIVMLFGAVTALAFGLLAHFLRRWLTQPAAMVLFILAAACVAPSLLTRPHILVLPILVLWSAGLILAKDKGTSPSLLLLPLMLLWANLHASFVFGLVLTLPIALEALVETKADRGRVVRSWGIFFVAATAVSLLTPNGLHGLLYPFEVLSMPHLSFIGEFAPTDFGKFQPLEGILMALLYFAFTRQIRLPIPRLILLIGLLHLALQHGRNQMIAGIVGALILAEPIGRALGGGRDESADCLPSVRWAFLGLAYVMLLTVFRVAHPVVHTDDGASPTTALNHVPAEILRQPVFNSYEFGGYLIFRNIKPFIDGRADVYGDEFLANYVAATTPNGAAFERIVEKYGIRWAILNAKSTTLDMLDALPHWRRLYADRIAVVYVRDEKRQ